MVKKALIVITLVDESRKKDNAELEKEIFVELSKVPSVIPWMKKVLKVEVFEELVNRFSVKSLKQNL